MRPCARWTGSESSGPGDGEVRTGRQSTLRELISAGETGDRWAFGEVTAEPDESVATHLHPGEAEAFVILEGEVELHGARSTERGARLGMVTSPLAFILGVGFALPFLLVGVRTRLGLTWAGRGSLR
jgi:hypothetical protein